MINPFSPILAFNCNHRHRRRRHHYRLSSNCSKDSLLIQKAVLNCTFAPVVCTWTNDEAQRHMWDMVKSSGQNHSLKSSQCQIHRVTTLPKVKKGHKFKNNIFLWSNCMSISTNATVQWSIGESNIVENIF